VVLIGGLLGIWALGRRRAVLLYATLALYFVFAWIDRLGNWYQVIMPAYPLVLIGFAAGIARAIELLSSTISSTRNRLRLRAVLHAVVALALILLVALRMSRSLPGADNSDLEGDTGLRPGQAILSDEPADGAALVGDQLESVSLAYLTDIWMVRPDLHSVSTGEAAHLLASGELRVYSTFHGVSLFTADTGSSITPWSAGHGLVELRSAPTLHAPEVAHATEKDLGDGLKLLGYDLSADQRLLSLYWRASGIVSQDWSISVRPTSGGQYIHLDGGIAQVDSKHPVRGLYPTSQWVVGEVVRDDYSLDLTGQGGADGLRIVLYRQDDQGFVNLAEVDLVLG